MLQFFEPPHFADIRKTVIVLWYSSPIRREEPPMAKHMIPAGAGAHRISAALTRFSSHRRARPAGWRTTLLQKFAMKPVAAVPDPVSLAIFAIDRVGPAAVRACASGVEVFVAAPDEATAEVFRAALAETAQRRSTDQLIRIVVD
jgi:hypothetical protein